MAAIQIDLLSKRVNDLSKQKDAFAKELFDAKKKKVKVLRGRDIAQQVNVDYCDALDKAGIDMNKGRSQPAIDTKKLRQMMNNELLLTMKKNKQQKD